MGKKWVLWAIKCNVGHHHALVIKINVRDFTWQILYRYCIPNRYFFAITDGFMLHIALKLESRGSFLKICCSSGDYNLYLLFIFILVDALNHSSTESCQRARLALISSTIMAKNHLLSHKQAVWLPWKATNHKASLYLTEELLTASHKTLQNLFRMRLCDLFFQPSVYILLLKAHCVMEIQSPNQIVRWPEKWEEHHRPRLLTQSVAKQ